MIPRTALWSVTFSASSTAAPRPSTTSASGRPCFSCSAPSATPSTSAKSRPSWSLSEAGPVAAGRPARPAPSPTRPSALFERGRDSGVPLRSAAQNGPRATRPARVRISRMLDGLGRTRGDGQHEGARRARDRVHAAGRPPRVVAGRADAGIVGHTALENEDLLIPDMAVAGNRRAGLIAHQDGLMPAVRILPEHLPEDALGG